MAYELDETRLALRTVETTGDGRKEREQAMKHSAFIRGIVTGMVGGLAGTSLMYFFGAGIFLLLGWPANTSITIIGNSAAAFFAKLGVVLAGGPSLGIWLFFQIGLIFGAILGVTYFGLEPFYLASPKKRVMLSILYVEGMSVPLLAAGTLALKMEAHAAVVWFGISFVMHLVYGLVLGMVLNSRIDSVKLYRLSLPLISMN